MSRPRKFASDASKQKAHRDKKRIEKVRAESDSKGQLHGETSGGFGGRQLEEIYAARYDSEGELKTQRQVAPAGHGSDESSVKNFIASGGHTSANRETESTFVNRHLTNSVLQKLIAEKGHLYRDEAEVIVKELVRGKECPRCDQTEDHYWTEHAKVIRDVLKARARSRGCPKAFHQLLLDRHLEVKCPVCGKSVWQPSIANVDMINKRESREDLFNQVLGNIYRG